MARAGSHIFNWGTVGVAAALAWLVIDPLLDAVYVLRCFYGESLTTGEDLRATLRRTAAVVVMLLALLPAARAQTNSPTQSIDPVKLDRSIDEVIHRREFTWRVPRPAGALPQGRWVNWVRSAADLVHRAWDYVKRVIEEWLKQNPEKDSAGNGAPVTRRMLELLIALVVALIVGAAVAFYLRRRKTVVAAKSVSAADPPSISETIRSPPIRCPKLLARQLADEWLAQGDCRLAMRALYLAGLNYLGSVAWFPSVNGKAASTIAASWSAGRDRNPDVHPCLPPTIAQFEQIWYGLHTANREMVVGFAAGLARIKRASLE